MTMTAGDVKADVSGAVASMGYYTVQPPAGEEWLITEIGSSKVSGAPLIPLVRIYISDGANDSIIFAHENGLQYRAFKIFITNGNYLKIQNYHGADAAYLCYTGVQLK
jgi:hypothetical protein